VPVVVGRTSFSIFGWTTSFGMTLVSFGISLSTFGAAPPPGSRGSAKLATTPGL